MRRFAPAALLLVPACASLSDAADGPFYGSGVSDGCRTAEARNLSFSVREYRDEALFDAEPSYRAGWRAGYAQCQPAENISARPEDFGQQDTDF
ncbi:hypothetical protein [Parvularcula dongshanensis]|uniref:Lipoprotein n=1 Tax=Parvularcula dongshanensis TaxID=1173995 RepID=A0A840I2V1_9PROT|nr:hypothetical protein [Parvularcula dongshanensis]MBB4658518.1 hypothetical protein [Parvularcula dongshanensis]